MSWKKFVKPVNSVLPTTTTNSDTYGYTHASKYTNWLPEVYAGPSDRIQRYGVYDQMLIDHEISAAMDTFADFGTEPDPITKLPFKIKWNITPTNSEIEVISSALQSWVNINKFNQRLWRTFRSTLAYGDQFFIRDPETYQLYWVDPSKVERIYVDNKNGKKVCSYKIKDVDLNATSLVASKNLDIKSRALIGGPAITVAAAVTANTSYVGSPETSGNHTTQSVYVDAEHMVHLSLTEGLTNSWPFGTSVLETIYRVYKQKSLIEDAILIYRVHRAPERRMFYIDVGTMPPNKASQYLDRIRYEVQQKRMPSKTGGGTSVTDSTFNPMSMLEDYFFAVTSDGRGSKVDVLQGGSNLGEIDDLKFFNNQMVKALGVPASYLPSGPDDGATVSDGKVGTAYIQEYRFAKVVSRYQKLIVSTLDMEFKLYLKKKGVTLDNSSFELEFPEPQSFSDYRQLELDSARINAFTALMDVPFISKRYVLKMYLGWTEEQIQENEKMWLEEKGRLRSPVKAAKSAPMAGLGQVGITNSGLDGMADVGDFDDLEGSDITPDTTDQEVDKFGSGDET